MGHSKNASMTTWQIMLLLVLCGEIIFGLPFQTMRFFRPSMLEALSLTNTQLGDVFAAYGLAAMIAYFPGGTLADRFEPGKLMAISLFATGLGGLYYAQLPSFFGLQVLFAYWGVTSILLFWAAMIKATREWGGAVKQGRAFGLLEGGRGLVAAVISSIAVLIFSLYAPVDSDTLTSAARAEAVVSIIYFYTALACIMAIFAWRYIPSVKADQLHSSTETMAGISSVLKQKTVWCQAIIVVCAYCAYKGIDNYSLYAVQVLNMSELEAAQFTSLAAYTRPIAAVAAGFLADKILGSRLIISGFVLLSLCYIFMVLIDPSKVGELIIFANLIISMVAVFGIRGVYFALIAESKTKINVTGTAVGVISVLGFTPDVFFASISGRILDASPGLVGFQNYFLLLTGFAVLGMLVTIAFVRFNRHNVTSISD